MTMTNGIQLKTNKYNYFMLGFESLNDFKKSFLGTWYKELTFAVAVAIGFVYFGIDTVLMHVESVAYAPAKAMIMALALIIFDWAISVGMLGILPMKLQNGQTDWVLWLL